MRKIILTFIFIFSIFSYVQAKDLNIYVYQNNKVLGQFTPTEFKALVKGADCYVQETEAEKSEKTFRVEVIGKPIQKGKSDIWECKFSIKWFDQKGMVLKGILVTSDIFIPQNREPEWRVIYKNIAEIGFPVSVGVIMTIVFVIIAL